MEIKNYCLKNKVYKLNDLITINDAYIGGFDNQSLIKLVQKNKAAYVENGLLMLEGGLNFVQTVKKLVVSSGHYPLAHVICFLIVNK
ncbi:hypothetical protein [Virgibacillus dokdonensis]|uniref:Uncharacterized protein n=1 Tax=Virgibacillus dokdonensis TaxID=302167 RepID=A0A2K9IWZ4_9BACI|nr:hypothetical protein [Virgibacillus dokdonensis]AUJ24288.1 hypothetical protein A21D_01189 [Virgibacillus dokdonensis]